MPISTADLSSTAELPSPTTTPILTPETAYLDIIGAALHNGCDDRVLYTISCISSTIELMHDLDAHQLSHCAQVFNESLRDTTNSSVQARTFSQIEAGATFAASEVPHVSILTTIAFRQAARIYALGEWPRRSGAAMDVSRWWSASMPANAFRVFLPARMERERDRRFRAVVIKMMEAWGKDDDTREGMGEWTRAV
ncbi:hypothetical protein VE01_08322 [Pseudogymnoascus verrucosus]|uniref:Uncharacterized protein n=1 Tax=Pseudogymnoascus verrucosus TaxID=342668 RepID=A0A1B8GCP0_9PEZI|nr:uncharacterized protein VE01_08322 [Pseudogymnoascus verrucosus]OBT93606.1 hypothetical protein VE01_08322 [Pseudogymnoascus verrucosus]